MAQTTTCIPITKALKGGGHGHLLRVLCSQQLIPNKLLGWKWGSVGSYYLMGAGLQFWVITNV